MTIGLLFWVLMVIKFIFGLYVGRRGTPAASPDSNYWVLGGSLLDFVLLFLLGWKVFGFIIKDT